LRIATLLIFSMLFLCIPGAYAFPGDETEVERFTKATSGSRQKSSASAELYVISGAAAYFHHSSNGVTGSCRLCSVFL